MPVGNSQRNGFCPVLGLVVLTTGLALPIVVATKATTAETNAVVSSVPAAKEDVSVNPTTIRPAPQPVTAEERARLEQDRIEAKDAEAKSNWSQAEAIWRRYLALEEKAYGPDHPEVAETLNSIGRILRQRGQYTEAESLFSRALVINEKVLGPSHLEIAATLNNIALNRYAQGHHAEAESLLVRALAIRESALGADHSDILTSLINLADTRKIQGRHAEAEPLLIRALAINERALGPNHPDTATSLDDLATNRQAQRRYAEAEPLYERALAIREKTLGSDHPSTADSLNSLAYNRANESRYAEAETLLVRALAIREKVLGPDHPDTANSLNNLAANRQAQGRYAEAEPFLVRALAVSEKMRGPDHPSTAISLNNLAANRQSQGRYAEAELLFTRALAIREKTFGPEHPSTATSLGTLASNRLYQGRYAEAEPLYERALAIHEKVFGPNHLDTASSLINLAANREAQGRFAEAEPLFTRALAIREKLLAPEDPGIAVSLDVLAKNRATQGRYAEAEPLLTRALAICEKVFGPEHPYTATSIANLASNRFNQGRYAEAELLYERALTIHEKLLGPNHPSTANSLNNLASIRYAQGRYVEAEPLYERALAILEKVIGPDHPDTAATLEGLARDRSSQGRYAEAEPLYERALSIREKALGRDHPSTADSLTTLADNHNNQRHFAQAEPLYERALAIREKALPSEHPNTAIGFNDLAFNRALQGRFAEALPLFRRAVAIRAGRIARYGDDGGEQRSGVDAFINLARLLSVPSRFSDLPEPDRLAEAFQALQYAGSADVARAVSGTLARAAASSDDLARLIRTRQDLALKIRTLSADLDKAIAKPAEQRDAAADTALRTEIAHTEADIGVATERLTRDFPRFAELANPRPASLADVQAALRPDEALVSWTVTPITTYLFVVRRGEARLQRVEIRDDVLRARVAALRDGLDPKGRLPIDMPPFDLAAAHALYRDLLGPAEDLIADARHLILVPSGPLESLPPAVLVTSPPPEASDEAERYRQATWLVRRQAVSVTPAVSSFVALRRFPKDEPAGSAQVADFAGAFAGYGDPDFQGAGSEVEQTPTPSPAQDRADAPVALASLFRGGVASPEGLHALPRLPDSADELRAIAHTLDAPDASVHLGREASVSAIKGADLSKVKVLAFATHGLIAGELPKLAEPALAFTPPAEPSATDDGLLRASQVAQLKLGAQFVVLSACNTAAPDGTPGASGLSGLAKAFFYAGARSLLVSHWPVDSGAATRLTTATFATLRAEPGIGRAEALRRASLALIDGGRPGNLDAHPMIWAPFTLVGEDGAEPASLTTSHADATQPTQKQ